MGLFCRNIECNSCRRLCFVRLVEWFFFYNLLLQRLGVRFLCFRKIFVCIVLLNQSFLCLILHLQMVKLDFWNRYLCCCKIKLYVWYLCLGEWKSFCLMWFCLSTKVCFLYWFEWWNLLFVFLNCWIVVLNPHKWFDDLWLQVFFSLLKR